MQQRKANPEGSTTTIDGKRIQLTVEKIDDTALEIAIINLDFSEDHRMAMKYLVVSLATCTILFLLLAVREIGIYSCAVGIIGFQVYRMLNLVKFGNLCMALVNDEIYINNKFCRKNCGSSEYCVAGDDRVHFGQKKMFVYIENAYS